MSKRAQYEVPAAIREAKQRFEEWRGSHSGRRPIPESLWRLAAELAREHGVFRTAQLLRLDYNKLKRCMLAAAPDAKPTAMPPPAFVELLASSASQPCECTIEIEGPRGRMRIEWKGSTAPDLPGLSRVALTEQHEVSPAASRMPCRHSSLHSRRCGDGPAGLAPNYVGLDQVNVVVPAIMANNAAPLTFQVNGTAGTQTLYLAVQ